MTMAAGDRNSKGRPTDIVRHKLATPDRAGKTMCGRTIALYASYDWDDTTCLSCLKKRDRTKSKADEVYEASELYRKGKN